MHIRIELVSISYMTQDCNAILLMASYRTSYSFPKLVSHWPNLENYPSLFTPYDDASNVMKMPFIGANKIQPNFISNWSDCICPIFTLVEKVHT